MQLRTVDMPALPDAGSVVNPGGHAGTPGLSWGCIPVNTVQVEISLIQNALEAVDWLHVIMISALGGTFLYWELFFPGIE